jgi:iron complex outermembrane receptor protein
MNFNHTGIGFRSVKNHRGAVLSEGPVVAMSAAKMKFGTLLAGVLIGSAGVLPLTALAETATTLAPASATDNSQLEEIIVTARKRAEDLQQVPISVTAVSTEDLREKSITSPYDLMFAAPGLNVREGNSTRDAPDYFIRGQGNTFGANPSVVVYFADAPLQTNATGIGDVQYYDLESVQVLKGPQGTLFGKSTTGGAVLYSPIKPSDDFGGYVDQKVGDYGMWETQAAINLPIAKDILAVRFAMDAVHRDGFTRSGSTGQEQDERNRQNYRLGINFTPVDGVKSYTLLQADITHEVPGSDVLIAFYPNSIPLYNTTPGVGTGYFAVAGLCAAISAPAAVPSCIASRTGRISQLVANTSAEAARLAAGGSIRQNLTTDEDKINAENYTITNNTSVDIGKFPIIGDVSFRNIFSAVQVNENNVIREFGVTQYNNGTVINQYDLVGPPPQSLSASDAAQKSSFHQNTTEEFQINGEVGAKTSWIVGYFLNHTTRDTPQLPPIFTTFNNAFTIPLDNLNFLYTSLVTQSRQAESGYFAQFNADLSDLVLNGLSFTGGERYSEDYTKQVYRNFVQTPTGSQVTTFNHFQNYQETAPTYTVALNYQINPDLMTYVTSRTGFKPGGVNGTAASVQGVAGVNPTFGPEHLRDIELGLKSTWELGGIRGRSNVAVYHNWYDNIQRSQTIALPPSLGGGVTTQTNNIAAASITGLELENTIKITNDLWVYFNYSYINAYYTAYPGSTLNNFGVMVPNISSPYVGVPRNQETLGVRYALPLDKSMGPIAASAEYYRQSGIWLDDSLLQDARPDGYQPSYGNLNLRLDWNSIYGAPVDAGFFVTNATNNVHLVGVGSLIASLGYIQGSYSEPRMYGFEVRYRFGSDAAQAR